MFLTELSPLFQELVHKPVAFMGGFVSGLLKLSLTDEPVSKWLDQQAGCAASTPTASGPKTNSGPQSISID
ncbi:MAG: hypothetical protein KME35_23025 [Aphanocapsa sp. GSE-SYN-MK-11-07L]|jgi:hypothetical protein|nr:hypothetical protein [Aphanocapsa sp. GSE-SYN-MK-11-07L]